MPKQSLEPTSKAVALSCSKTPVLEGQKHRNPTRSCHVKLLCKCFYSPSNSDKAASVDEPALLDWFPVTHLNGRCAWSPQVRMLSNRAAQEFTGSPPVRLASPSAAISWSTHSGLLLPSCQSLDRQPNQLPAAHLELALLSCSVELVQRPLAGAFIPAQLCIVAALALLLAPGLQFVLCRSQQDMRNALESVRSLHKVPPGC